MFEPVLQLNQLINRLNVLSLCVNLRFYELYIIILLITYLLMEVFQ